MSDVTIGELIARLLPGGTRHRTGRTGWKRCPFWQPDLFAVAASIVQSSGCYAEPGIALSRDAAERAAKRERALRTRRIGRKWSLQVTVPAEVQRLWSLLLAHSGSRLCEGVGSGQAWKAAAMELLAIADEACAGFGFLPPPESDKADRLVLEECITVQRGGTSRLHLPHSLCILVAPDVACVLPKALTPSVGCTLRSLSHNLALLPGYGLVKAEWYIGSGQDAAAQEHGLNLLLVPFPYVVLGSDFKVQRPPEPGIDGYFTLGSEPSWLRHGGKLIEPAALSNMVADLIRAAEHDVGAVHGIVLPETALTEIHMDHLANTLAGTFPRLELIISGIVRDTDGTARNEAMLIRLAGGRPVARFVQAKHHRWRLDHRQIGQYQLGHVLDPEHAWWEGIAVHDRRIQFGLTRHQAVIAALICEDLARFDPVLPVINAVGPNLVVALLMDGPQLERRWPGRYATVLAEDPGSSVLTLTSLGMVARSRRPGEEVKRIVGLWKERDGQAVELTLPPADHGIVLCLSRRIQEQRTLDLRSDGMAVVEYRLGGVRSVRLPSVPDWLERRPLLA